MKKQGYLCIAIVFISTTTNNTANSASWRLQDVDITFDSTFTFATSIRVEDRDINLIGRSNQLQFDWNLYNAVTNPIYQNADIWTLSDTGSYSTNGDLGNLSFDPGSAFSTQFIGLHELDINKGDIGFFARGFYFYDFEIMDNDRAWQNTITNIVADPCRDPNARDELCRDARILDFFVYADFYLGDMPVSLRVGEQVISWGESTLIQHSINTTNPVDVPRATAPGSELSEIFIPVGMFYGSIGLTDNLNLSAYYQYEYERSLLPVSGSFFSTNDFGGEGGSYNNIQLGFAGIPDIDISTVLLELNAIGAHLRDGTMSFENAVQAYMAYPTNITVREQGSKAHDEARNSGQYGIKLGWFAENLNETEFGFYHINYNSQRPLISGVTSNFSMAALQRDLEQLAANEITRESITSLEAFSKARFTYPEDIKLYGVSLNTNIGETAFAGEIAYRVDEPLQIDDVELLYMAVPQQLANAGLRPDLNGISQLNNIGLAVEPGETANGFLLSDTWQMQGTISHVFGPRFGSDNFTMLAEAAYVNIVDFRDPQEIRFGSPGTNRSPSIEPLPNTTNNREGLHIGLSDGGETNPFSTKDSWGYRIIAIAEINNVYGRFNLRLRGAFSHDVKGTTPDPLFLFLEDRQSASLSCTFDYLNKWSVTASYNAFWGGIGTTNELSDRDFVSFNIKYAM